MSKTKKPQEKPVVPPYVKYLMKSTYWSIGRMEGSVDE